MRLIISILFCLLFMISNAKANNLIVNIINNLNFDSAVKDVCEYDKSLCCILTDKNINKYLRKYYKLGLFVIVSIESEFKYKQGKYDKDDISYFQINKRYWTREKLKRLNVDYSYEMIKHNEYVSAKVALRVWFVNVASYIKAYNKYPKNLAEYIALYHRVVKIDSHYSYKARKLVFKYLNKFNKKDLTNY